MFKISKLFFCLLILCNVQASDEIDRKESVKLSQEDMRLYKIFQSFIINRNEIVSLRNDIALSLSQGNFRNSTIDEKCDILDRLNKRLRKVYNNCNLRNEFGDLSYEHWQIPNPSSNDLVCMQVYNVMCLKNDFYNKHVSADEALKKNLKHCSQQLRKEVRKIKRTMPILINQELVSPFMDRHDQHTGYLLNT